MPGPGQNTFAYCLPMPGALHGRGLLSGMPSCKVEAMEFKWETADPAEKGWDEESGPAGDGPRRWPWLALTLALILVGAGLAALAVRRQVGQTTRVLEQEVRAAHSVVVRAVAGDDPELFATMLSGRDQEWTEDQQRRLEAGLLLAETAKLFGWEPVGAATIQTVTFSPELQEAAVVTAQAYSVAGVTSTVSLQQTHIYRRGEEHWLLSPPEPAFWGGQATVREGGVVLTFPRRDEALALTLLREVQDHLAAACGQLSPTCARLPPVQVTLDPAPGSVLVAEHLPAGAEAQAGRMFLPAPSLLGEGGGADARVVLARSYAAAVVATVLNELSGYQCCAGRAFQEALLARQVAATRLPEWPVAATDYTAFVDNPLTAEQLGMLWAGQSLPPGAEVQAPAFVQFLQEASGLSSGELQRLLVKSGWLWPWLSRIGQSAPSWEWEAWESDWLAFLYRQANRVWGEPAAWPAEDLHLVCEDDEGEMGLYRYEVADEHWQRLRSLAGGYPTLVPAPGDRGVFVFDLSPRDASWLGTTWWQAGKTVAFDVPGADVVWRPAYPTREDPQGRYATMLRITTDEPIPEGVGLFDLTSCDARGCAWRALPGRPLWSPDGTQLLIETGGGEWLRGTREALSWEPVLAGRAAQVFWTHRDEIGFVSPDRQTLAFTDEGGTRQTVTVDSLLAQLPADVRRGRWRIAAVVPVLDQDPALLVAVALAASEMEQLFLVAQEDARVAHLLGMEDGSVAWLRDQAVAPGRRWLALFASAGGRAGLRFLMYDLQSEQAVIDTRGSYFPGVRSFDWAQEGGWLARLGLRVIELAAPDGSGGGRPYRHFVPTPGLRCTSIAWVTNPAR